MYRVFISFTRNGWIRLANPSNCIDAGLQSTIETNAVDVRVDEEVNAVM